MNQIGRERGWAPTNRAHFDQSRGPGGALFVGNPEAVAEKIVAMHKIFRNDRFLLQMAIGLMPHDTLMKAIELFGTKVAPLVRKETAVSPHGRRFLSACSGFIRQTMRDLIQRKDRLPLRWSSSLPWGLDNRFDARLILRIGGRGFASWSASPTLQSRKITARSDPSNDAGDFRSAHFGAGLSSAGHAGCWRRLTTAHQISRLVRPLRVHLSVVIVLLLIGVSIPIMWLSYEQGKRAAIAKAEDQMGMQSQHTIDRYRAILGDGYSVVTIASVIERLLSQPNVDLDIKIAFLIKALEGSPYVNNIYVGYPDGGYLQAANAERNQAWIKVSDAPPETVFVVRTIERLSEPPLSIWRFLDRSGKVLAQRSSHDVNFDPRKRPWYKEALKAGGPVSVGPYVTAATQSLSLTMAVPMAKNKSAIAGVDVLLETISRSLAHDLVSEHARGFVFDSQRR